MTIQEMDVDRYSRTVALMAFEGWSVNLDLVARGLAWYYGQYCKTQPICNQIKAAEAPGGGSGPARSRRRVGLAEEIRRLE